MLRYVIAYGAVATFVLLLYVRTEPDKVGMVIFSWVVSVLVLTVVYSVIGLIVWLVRRFTRE